MRSLRFGFFPTVVVTAVFAFSLVDASAQELNPIHWSVKKENSASAVKAGDKFNAQVIATIDEGWHLYSLEQPAGGPITTHISVPKTKNSSWRAISKALCRRCFSTRILIWTRSFTKARRFL